MNMAECLGILGTYGVVSCYIDIDDMHMCRVSSPEFRIGVYDRAYGGYKCDLEESTKMAYTQLGAAMWETVNEIRG